DFCAERTGDRLHVDSLVGHWVPSSRLLEPVAIILDPDHRRRKGERSRAPGVAEAPRSALSFRSTTTDLRLSRPDRRPSLAVARRDSRGPRAQYAPAIRRTRRATPIKRRRPGDRPPARETVSPALGKSGRSPSYTSPAGRSSPISAVRR